MKHRFLALVAAIVLAFTFVAPVAAHADPGNNHLNADCDDGNAAYRTAPHFYRNVPAVYGARGRITVRELYPCHNPGDTLNVGWSAVLPANIQGSNNLLAQLGILKMDCVNISIIPCPPGGWLDEVIDFVWTPNSYAGGQVARASWVDFDSNGVHDKPVIGQSYEFSIAYLGPTGEKYWSYCVKALSLAGQPVDCTSNSAIGVGNKAWFGYEALNSATAVGRKSGTGAIDMMNMAYRNVQGGSYLLLLPSQLGGQDLNCSWAFNHPSFSTCLEGYHDLYGSVLDVSSGFHQ